MQNQILTHYGHKKVTKTERSVEFSHEKKTTARDFLWHLRRINHWWNCCSKDKSSQAKPLEVVVVE